MVNPEKVSASISSLSTGLLAVLATLKMSFARAVTLGIEIIASTLMMVLFFWFCKNLVNVWNIWFTII